MKFVKKKLCDVEIGKDFEVWGHAYTVLDSDENGVFVLEADVICEVPFREEGADYKVAPNDFRDSSVRAYLIWTYLKELVSKGADLGRDIRMMELDLKCTLGQHEYEIAQVHAGLLTLEQYGKYYDIIPRIDRTYWLATPWKTPSLTSNTNNTDYVWLIDSNGCCNSWYYHNSCGVRPTLTLDPSLLVSVECDEEEEVDDTITRSKNLDMWNEYLNYLIKWAVTHANDEDYIGDQPFSYYDDWDKE